MPRLTRLMPVALRAAGLSALLLLLWNPVATRKAPTGLPPVVLLDASLSMTATDGGARWRAALDSARAAAGGNGVVWRFGSGVAPFDSTPPADGSSLLGPALEAAAARGGEIVVVTDGELTDLTSLPPDLVTRARVIPMIRPPAWDAFVARVDGPARVAASDTVRLTVHYGTAGSREASAAMREAWLVATVDGRRLASRRVSLPDSGTLRAELAHPASRLPRGWAVVQVSLEGVMDSEPRDNARLHILHVSPEPSVVVAAAPPSWEARFLAQALDEVAGVPVRVFVDPGGGWRDGRTLAPVGAGELWRAARAARLVVLVGDPRRVGTFGRPALLSWPEASGRTGDWYLDPPPPSPLAGALAGVDWSALPPATAVRDLEPDSGAIVALTATLARRGPARPVVVLRDSAGVRGATVLASGLWRWRFRGGASAVAYRLLVSALVDWLLGSGAPPGDERSLVAPESRVVANGSPLVWRWVGAGGPGDLALRLEGLNGARTDTLRFGPDGRARLHLPPGVYRYAAAGSDDRGVVAVETYSEEWRPRPVTLGRQPGRPGALLESVALRDRWWLFVLALAAFVAEWAWRRRQGLA
ncbi:MAG TPA: hypothetical protein VNI61_01530 [Gemmatimonadales bacterium]|nr:hypothetical protein [Gemmatimonadales bacterium]